MRSRRSCSAPAPSGSSRATITSRACSTRSTCCAACTGWRADDAPMKDRFARYALIWVLLLASIWLGDRFIRTLILTADTPRTVTPRGELSEIERHRIALFENAAPSVVYLFTEGPARGGERRAGAGSGFVWDAAGHVVTNYHVIDGASRVRVRLDSGAAIDAKVIGGAPDQDLAVVQLAETRE